MPVAVDVKRLRREIGVMPAEKYGERLARIYYRAISGQRIHKTSLDELACLVGLHPTALLAEGERW